MKRYNAQANGTEKRGKFGFRREWGIALFGVLMATALPALTAMLCGLGTPRGDVQPGEEMRILVCRHNEEEREELALSRILTLSLAATNSSDTPAASLEAQAVVLRSRAVWWMGYCDGGEEVPVSDHARKTLCDSPAHGLPYRSAEQLKGDFGEKEADARIDAAKAAVDATRGRVLCYRGEVIPALLHHSSGGLTRAVESLPWLAAVPTPEAGSVTFHRVTSEEARTALAARFGLLLPASPAEWELTLTRTEADLVETVTVGETALSGTVFADALSLPSGSFTVELSRDALLFTCTGVGSGCGLSREGAAVYARGGLCMAEILAHYYPDCTLGVLWE